MAGSSVEIEHCTPASSSVGSGWSASVATAPVRRFESGQTSSTRPRPAISAHQAGVLDGADAVPDAVGVQRLDRALHAGRAGHLAGVRHARQAQVARQLERVDVQLGRVLGLEPAEADAEHAAVAVPAAVRTVSMRLLLREAARDVGRQADLDAVPLARLVDTVAEAGEDLVPGRRRARTRSAGEKIASR